MNLSLWFNKCVSFSTTQSQGAEMITVTTKQINGYSRTAVINVNGQIVKTRTNFQYCAISFRDEDIVTPEGTFVRFARIIARAGTFANLKKSANRRFYCGRGCKLVLINLDTESVYDSAGQTYEQTRPFAQRSIPSSRQAGSATIAATRMTQRILPSVARMRQRQ